MINIPANNCFTGMLKEYRQQFVNNIYETLNNNKHPDVPVLQYSKQIKKWK